ncbi:HIT family protein [Hydrogenimonas cancrithermarum]|uniref:Hydrolase n=1 Tax=Hydrogenimonas cancrithermarum TaxID=2993563 RepID=A0ABM8FI05_9BACT|nr:HIT domain-containing protein [Hydrogenimonas cancrithermarum]BDY11878.1 hydrolase [Hydrogenimonas cancrithermarum]
MEHLYAPWRTEYIRGEKIEGCVFCHISQHPDLDEKHHLLFRDERCFVVMNKYPYTPGHFMIIPHIHTERLETLDPRVWLRMSELTQRGVAMLKEGFGAEGVNMGMNLGAAAGAGIAEHIHLHLVPRFSRDTNFITTIGHTRVYSTDFQKVYEKLKGLVPKYFV